MSTDVTFAAGRTSAIPQIRRAKIEDVPALLPLIADYWAFEVIPGYQAPHLTRLLSEPLARLLSDPHLGCGFIGFLNDKPVGYLLAVYVFSLEHAGMTAEIDEFYVVPEQRGHGVGSKLLDAAEAEFTRLGCTNVSLQLSRRNNSARAFYHRHGYAERQGYELLEKMLDAY